jgi:cephalosporin-C deacetylase-like acetyl esterase
MIELGKVNGLAGWRESRGEIEKAALSLLGPLPKNRVELQAKTVDEDQCLGYTRKRINYFVDEWERVSAWLFVPEEKEEMPALLCCHDMVAQGKDEAAGFEGDPLLFFAQHYAELGYVTLAPDCITAGDRVSSGLAPYDTKSFYKDHPKSSVLGKMLSDHIYGLDMLSEVKHVDSARIGVVGHGLGGTNALLLAAFDERVQACVASCGFARFSDDKQVSRWVMDEAFAALPKLREAIEKKSFPFDWEHVLALAAPTPTLVLTALNDDLLPAAKSCEKATDAARSVYRLLGATGALEIESHQSGRRMTTSTLEAADEWLERWL